MPETAHGKYGWTRSSVRWLVVLTCLVVLVDIGAGVLTLVSSHKTDSARDAVTAGQDYDREMNGILEATLDAETSQRGYLLTGEKSYLDPAELAVKGAPALLKELKSGSRGDPVLRRDFPKLLTLLESRLKDLVLTVDLYEKGKKAEAIAVVKTNRGNRMTQQIRTLTAAMIKRSDAMVNDARARSHNGQVWASRAAIAAYVASGVLLVLMVMLIRNYLLSETARQESITAQVEAERLNEAKSGFLSRVSHELRTPLNAILGFGQLLEREQLDEGQRETLDQMLTGGRHLLAIVDDLLDLSRIETGELRLSVEPVQVLDAISEARSMLTHAATTSAVGVRSRPVDPDLFVRADRQRLLQVLLNLVSNAIKYNRRGGNVVIGASHTRTNRVRVEITDTGFGIPAEQVSQLFTPFERLDAANRGIEGTGLGLAVARGLIEAMGGTLDMSSKVDVGTTVWFELPAASVAEVPPVTAGAPAASTNGASPTPSGHLISVLYVEDNPSNVRLVEKIFALGNELSLSVAREAAQGLAMARDLHPDVILLDLHLPDMSGEQVLAALLADPETAAIPVIIVSADASPTQIKRLRAAGAHGYLTKPFGVDQLLAAIRAGGTPAPPSVTPDTSGGLLDASMVSSLHMLADNPAVGHGQIGEMLVTFRYDADGTLRSLHDATAEGDMAVAAREAHRLAGGSGTVGAGRFRLMCKELEHHANSGDAARVRALDAELDAMLDRTWEALTREFADELRDVSSPPTAPQSG